MLKEMDLFSIMVVSLTKQDKSKYNVKDNELFKMKDVSTEMKHKSDCYVKVIKKDYKHNSKLILKFHLLFLSKLHYKKIRKIEKMFEKYYDFKKILQNRKRIYSYLLSQKKIKNYLKECKVIEVLSDDIEAFETRFYHIIKFVTESYIFKPQKRLISYEGEENTEYTMCYSVEKNVNERLKKSIVRVSDLMIEKNNSTFIIIQSYIICNIRLLSKKIINPSF